MRIGLFGFPMTGKSTLFRLLTGLDTSAAGHKRETQVGVTRVPDPRLDELAAMYKPRKVVPATIEYLDLVPTSSKSSPPSSPPSKKAVRRTCRDEPLGNRDHENHQVSGGNCINSGYLCESSAVYHARAFSPQVDKIRKQASLSTSSPEPPDKSDSS